MQASQQVPQEQDQKPEIAPLQKAIRVLSIDGGGIRGVAVARILEEIEKRTGKRIHELFDVIVGTSTGGLLAVMMSVEIPAVPAPTGQPMCCREAIKRDRQFDMRIDLGLKAGEVLTATQARELYEKKAKKIFHEADAGFLHRLLEKIPGMEKAIHFFETKYEKGVGLKKIVKDLYIHNSLLHARTCCGVVVTERGLGTALLLNSTHAKVQGHHNYHNNISLTKMVRATSAAPTYFKSIHVHHPCVAKHKHGDNSKVGLREKLKIKLTSALWGKSNIEHKLCDRQMLFFEDGGVSCNNPSKKGLNYAKELLKEKKLDHHGYQFQIYSLGTGATEYDEVDPAHEMIEKLERRGGKLQSGNWDSLGRLLNDPFSISRLSYRNHIRIQEKLQKRERRSKIPQKYFRLQFKVTREQLSKLDDSSKKHIGDLIKSAEDCIKQNRVFEDIINSLEVPVERPEGLNKVKPILKLVNFEMRLCMMDRILRKINHQFGRGEMRLCMMDKIWEAMNPQVRKKQKRLSMLDKVLERVQSEMRLSCVLKKSGSLVCQPLKKYDSCRL